MLSVARNTLHVVLNMQEFSFGGNLQMMVLPEIQHGSQGQLYDLIGRISQNKYFLCGQN